MENLLLEIVKCPNLSKNASHNNPCSEIIECQAGDLIQVPEPWNGNLYLAPMLFISSNPSINTYEEFPTKEWDVDIIIDFFNNRFSEKTKWVENELYPLQKNNEYTKTWIRFWGAIRKTASTLLERRAVSGQDYAMTEIVRCKSINEKGVEKAKFECANKYLERTLMISPAKLVICLGEKVSDVIKLRYNICTSERMASILMGELLRTVIFLPHPNARKERSIEKLFTAEELNRLRLKLKSR